MPRILGVDDSAQNRALIELYLQGQEFEVVTVSSGREALDLCRSERFDLILLDIAMPQIDGFEVCRRLKDDPRTAFTPVIFLTGKLGDESMRATAFRLGAVDYIQKPVDREELTARIRVMFRMEEARSRLDRENETLRQQLEGAQAALAALAARAADLAQLRDQLAASAEQGLVLVDANRCILAADAPAERLLGVLSPGQALGAQNHLQMRIANLLGEGAADATLRVGKDGEAGKCVHVRVHRLADQGVAVVVRDVTLATQVEERLRGREAADPPPPTTRASEYAIADFVGAAASVRELTDKVGKLRDNRSTVLIYGESGVGKELIARALHFDGKFRATPFLPIHCGAIAPELIESELFGHEKGAFTGAQQSRIGLFEAADGGSIFLDEVAEMSLDIQVKLLRVLQRGEIRPVGASQPRLVDVRILAATNRDLLAMVKAGTFREDLYYRLEVVTLQVPPLRERREDIPRLVAHFLSQANRRHDRLQRPTLAASRQALTRLVDYPWPGNVRELENAIEGAFALGVGEVLQEEDLPKKILLGQPDLVPRPVRDVAGEVDELDAAGDLRSLRNAAERRAMEKALADCAGDRLAAAQSLGMSRSTFYRRARLLGL